jgi:hypothetical protein
MQDGIMKVEVPNPGQETCWRMPWMGSLWEGMLTVEKLDEDPLHT